MLGQQVVCDHTAATLIAAAGGYGYELVVVNRGAASVFLGGAGVDNTGFELKAADAPVRFHLRPDDGLYGLGNGVNVRVDVLASTSQSVGNEPE